MRNLILSGFCLGIVLSLAGCNGLPTPGTTRAVQDINLIDDSNLNDIMLTVADPAEAVAHFSRGVRDNPDRIDLQRGLGRSLVRAGRATEALRVWRTVLEMPDTNHDDRVDYADALIRSDEWEKAGAELARIPPTHETFERYRLEAMVADSRKDWARADSFYETAAGLTTRPAGVLNNWGFSKLSRGEFAAAERLFAEAISYDPNLFTAKNNLVMARGAQKNYTLPQIQTSQTERAQLLHTLALSAIKQGDVNIGKTLLREAIETHPQHFDIAVRALRALEG